MLLVSMTEWGLRAAALLPLPSGRNPLAGELRAGSFHLGRCRAETVKLWGCNFVRKMRAMVRWRLNFIPFRDQTPNFF
jgi:hypothetical protein